MSKKLKCVLLIDDSEFDNFLHKMIIEKAEITEKIKVATDGTEALELCAHSNGDFPELILLDINMPGMGGFEFMKKFQDKIQENKSAVYMLSTSNYPTDISNAQNFEQIKGFLNKPLTVSIIKQLFKENFQTDN